MKKFAKILKVFTNYSLSFILNQYRLLVRPSRREKLYGQVSIEFPLKGQPGTSTITAYVLKAFGILSFLTNYHTGILLMNGVLPVKLVHRTFITLPQNFK